MSLSWRGACAVGATLFALPPLGSFAAPATPQSFTGTISDTECDAGSHAHMKMGKDDAECTIACVDAHGASYVLWDGTLAYLLSDQQAPQAFAGRRVTVVGALDAATRTIVVESIAPAR